MTRNVTRPQVLRFGQPFPIGTRLRRRLDSGALEPAEFHVAKCEDLDCPLGKHLLLACPKCGEVTELLDDYNVDRSGVVSPLWQCPSESCALAQWLELDSVFE